MNKLEIQITQDFICPWCWIGEQKLKDALAAEDATSKVRLVFAPYELNPLYQNGPLSSLRGVRLLFSEVNRQALVLSYIDVFWLLAAVAVSALVLVPFQRPSPVVANAGS